MSPVIVACVLAACFIPHASVAQERRPTSAPAATVLPVPAEDLCQLEPFNIKNLTREAYWFTNATLPEICSDPNATSCTFYFSFCKALKLPFNAKHCDGSAVCLVSKDAQGKELHNFSLGQFILNETQFYESNDTERGGFYMEVTSDSTNPQCNNTGVSTRIELVCDPSVKWMTQDLTKNNISNVEVDDTCSYKITLRYAGACLPYNPSLSSTSMPSPTPTTASSSVTTTVGPTHLSSTTVNRTASSSMPSRSTSVTLPGTMTVTTASTSPTSQSTQSQTVSMMSGTAMPTGTPTSSPLPPPHTTSENPPHPPKTHPSTTKPIKPTEPTANPLASKVSGLTAGIIIFALLFFAMLLVAIGLVWYFKFHKNRYHKLPNEDL